MKLAFVIFRYFPFGGLQRDMLAIAQAAQLAGHQVSIFCGDWQGEKVPGIDVVEIKTSGFLNIAGVKNFVDRFQKIFRRDQFDLLVGFNKMPGLDVYYCGDSCFAKKAYENRSIFYRLTARARLYLHYEKMVYSHLSKTHILEVSAAERPEFAKYYATVDSRQTLLPPGIDRDLKLSIVERVAARKKIRTELGLGEGDYLILCVGSGYKTKGLDRSLRSFAAFRESNPSALLAIAGNGNSHPFQSLVAGFDLHNAARFLGGRNDMADLYAASDLLLHPAYQEVTGNVIVEAMYCAVPVLATPVCGYSRYIVDFAMGELLQKPDNAQIVAAQMKRILEVDFQHWYAQAQVFANASDIFSRPERVVKELEELDHAQTPRSLMQSTKTSKWVLCDELIAEWKDKDVFHLVRNMQGSIARETKDRQTLRFEHKTQVYYRKWHSGVGWREIIKNILQLRLPVLGAATEWNALNKLYALNIPSLVPVAYGVRGKNPARQESFVVTRELNDVVQLDHYFEQGFVALKNKRILIRRVAELVRSLHDAGINHRDLYLCHFMLKPDSLTDGVPEIYLIDLHRAQCRARVPQRWQIKDIAALYYSTLNLGFNRRDTLCFLKCYFNCSLRDLLIMNAVLLKQIQRRALHFYWRDFGHAPASY